MNRKIINIIYLLAFFPSTVLAQIRSNPDSLEQPNIWYIFSSVSGFLYVILGGIGALSIVGFFIAAVDYLAAGGDEERVGRSGKIFSFSLIGIIIAVIGIIAINIAGGTINR
jgi:hypothetical protein